MATSHIAVIDPNKEGVGYLAFDLEKPMEREMFDTLFDFHESSLDDFPEVEGIREFTDADSFTVLVADDLQVLTNEVLKRCSKPVLMA